MNYELINTTKNNEKGSIGIGAMIVFIALILVAAVASTVIIKTAEELQDRAEKTGDDTRDQISGKLLVTDAYIASIDADGPDGDPATADDNVNAIRSIVVIAKLASGSDNTLPSNMQWFVVCNNNGIYADSTQSIGTTDQDLGLVDRTPADAALASGEQFAFTMDLGDALDADSVGNCMDAALVGTSLSVTLNVQGGGDTRLDLEIEEVSVAVSYTHLTLPTNREV